MIKHKDHKDFGEKLKKEEQSLSKQRNISKPEASEISSMKDHVPTSLSAQAATFELPKFLEV
jgi:hypothetical protein